MLQPLPDNSSHSVPRLKLSCVTKRFGPTEVLKNINFSINSGEVVALLGDNGAGKSTLIKIICGYHPPSDGNIYFDGNIINAQEFGPNEARALGIQTVYQHLGLVDSLSIARNFFLGLEPKKRFLGLSCLDIKAMRQVVREQLSAMGIRRKLDPDDPVAKLSGGERQAIAIARARYFGAKLLILDEPTSALSLRQTEEVLGYIRHAALEGISVIFITHTIHHVEGIADRVCILFHGELIAEMPAKSASAKQCAELITKGCGGPTL